jgi:hypothetical protein
MQNRVLIGGIMAFSLEKRCFRKKPHMNFAKTAAICHDAAAVYLNIPTKV